MPPEFERKRATGTKKVLAIDVGGTHVKFKLSPNSEKREFDSDTSLSAAAMVARVKKMTGDWLYDVVSVGFPGPVAGNRPVAEPHNLGKGWRGFDFAKAFGKPTKVVNDAAMQAVGSYAGGRMLFLGLGTGLGSAMILDGVIEPMELAHLAWKKGKSYEDLLGAAALEKAGKKKWRERVADAVAHLSAALEPDYVVLGGGNARKLKALPLGTKLGDNENAFIGGFRLWDGTLDRSRPAG